MSTKRAGIVPIGSKDTKIEVSFDGQQTIEELPGIMDFDITSGSAATYEGNPLREESFLRLGTISPGSMSIRAFDAQWHPSYSKIIEAHANTDLFYIRWSVPRKELVTLADPSGVAIAQDGTLTFTPANFPIGDQPFGIAAVLEVGNVDYVLRSIDIDQATKGATAVAYPPPNAAVAKTDAKIVRAGIRSDWMGVNVIDYANPKGGDGSATFSMNLRLQGQPARVVIDRSVT